MSDDDEAFELNSTAATVLGFLHDGPMTGWQLVATVEESVGPFWSITRSQVYRELAALADKGLLEAGDLGARDARPYTLTGAGREAFAAWAAQGPGQSTVRLPLLLFTTLGRHIGAERMAEVLARERTIQTERVRSLGAVLKVLKNADADPYLVATVDYGLSVSRASVRWIDRHRPAIAELATQAASAERTSSEPTSGEI